MPVAPFIFLGFLGYAFTTMRKNLINVERKYGAANADSQYKTPFLFACVLAVLAFFKDDLKRIFK